MRNCENGTNRQSVWCLERVNDAGAEYSVARSGSTTTLKSEGRKEADEVECGSRSGEAGSVASAGDIAIEGLAVASAAACSVCRVAVLGAPKVGKTTLARQLLTSEYLANKDNYHGRCII